MKKLHFFGTDGIRGVLYKDFDEDFFVKVGFAISKLGRNLKILVARDTRLNGEIIKQNLIKGLSISKVQIFDAGVVPTGGLCFLTKKYDFDYGIMITASHNPSEYNGVKIFDKNGFKLDVDTEFFIEQNLKMPQKSYPCMVKKFSIEPYLNFLSSLVVKNKQLSIFLDCANGATKTVAKKIFAQTQGKLSIIHTRGEINKNASVLDEKIFIKNFKKSKADIGFCFDGDGDRVMCITKDNAVLDGDKILYILSAFYNQTSVVGTIMTNLGLELALNKQNVVLIRTDVGDRNIAKELAKNNLLLGAEHSGHVIISNFSTTGDGLITALILLKIYCQNKKLFKKAGKLKTISTYSAKLPAINKEILNTPKLKKLISEQEKLLGNFGRLIVRPSGTEPIIRITVETNCAPLANQIIQTISKQIQTELSTLNSTNIKK